LYILENLQIQVGSRIDLENLPIFNPLHVLANKISVSDVEGMKILKLSQHPQIILQTEVMKTEVMKYQTLATPSSHMQKERMSRVTTP
jgi:hypothetical protein